MFSSQRQLDRKTPAQGINRCEFIAHLVEEYHTTTNVESQEQVTANLANFAYDPINWNFLKQAETLPLFMELLQSSNDKLQLHGTAGLCNICLDTEAAAFIINPINVKYVQSLLLATENTEILINCVTIFYQLLAGDPQNTINKRLLLTSAILKCIINWRRTTANQRVLNLCEVLLEDHASGWRVIEAGAKKLKRDDTTILPATSLRTVESVAEGSATDKAVHTD